MAHKGVPRGNKPRNDLTAEFVRSILDYDPQTGTLTWKVNHAARARKSQVAGKTSVRGYVSVGINGHVYLAHRLAWLIMTGEWPNHSVDHKFGQTVDNNWNTLRPANQSENGANSKLRRDSSSGFKGVSWSKSKRRWRAHVTKNYKHHHLGYFDTPEEAYNAYCTAARELHGEFVRTK